MHPILLLFLVDLIIVAPLTGWLANQKGRSPSGWFVAAVIAGPLAMLAVGLAPAQWAVEEARRLDRRCPRCDGRVSASARYCGACDAALPAEPAPASVTRSVPATRTTPPPTTEASKASLRSPADEQVRPAVAAPAPRPVEPEPAPAQPAAAPPVATRAPVSSPPDDEDEGTGHDLAQRRAVANIASGVFAGGVSELGAGYRYLISTSPTMLYISGPIDVAPTRIVFQSPRSTVDASHFEGDLVIVAESPVGRKRQLVFRGIAGADAAKVESLLARQPEPVAAPEPELAADPQPPPEAPAEPAAAPAPKPRAQPARRTRRTTKTTR